MKWVLVVLVFGLASCAPPKKSLPLPPYIKACSRNEPNMKECALQRARETIPHVVHGDRKYKVPPGNPLIITQLKVDEGVLGLNLILNNVKFYGLDGAVVDDLEVDLEKRNTRYFITLPRVEIACDYEIQGRILVLPITGKGPGNITLSDMVIDYYYEWDLVKKRDGTYVVPKNTNFNFNTTRMWVKLDNLFNGNKLLGDQMNVFMDENWKELLKDVGPIIGEAMAETLRSILANIFDLVSYENAFPDIPPTFNVKKN